MMRPEQEEESLPMEEDGGGDSAALAVAALLAGRLLGTKRPALMGGEASRLRALHCIMARAAWSFASVTAIHPSGAWSSQVDMASANTTLISATTDPSSAKTSSLAKRKVLRITSMQS
mmetsp:Transcript_90415/g.235378  ORF Transcript_90415/g.235378 Transcript_90415/m.235378 type:complete len:118 (+) Transcript_90415:266-619(+)